MVVLDRPTYDDIPLITGWGLSDAEYRVLQAKRKQFKVSSSYRGRSFVILFSVALTLLAPLLVLPAVFQFEPT